MKAVVFVLASLVYILAWEEAVYGFTCHTCQGGVTTRCATEGVGSKDCEGTNAQCYEALIEYQLGDLTLVQRRCWQTPEGSNATNFCDSFDNPVGRIRKCITCTTDLCNSDLEFWL